MTALAFLPTSLALLTIANYFLFVHSELSHYDGFTPDDDNAAFRPDVIECPSDEVITTKYKCHVRGQWIDCFRKHCCVGYTFIAGKCIENDKDPCAMDVCEQKCSLYFGRVVCTCYYGFKFDSERHRTGRKPYCVDVDECSTGKHDCEHFCENTVGGFVCICKAGFQLRQDNRTCESIDADYSLRPENIQKIQESRCVASCDVVSTLQTKIQELEEKLQAVTTAILLHSFGTGPPGAEGPTGPPGPPGPRGFPGPQGLPGTQSAEGAKSPCEESQSETKKKELAFVHVKGLKKNALCTRGPVGPHGPRGHQGPKGSKGDTGIKGEKGQQGSFDFFLLALADVRHDIELLQEAVFKDEQPERFDLTVAVREYQKMNENRPDEHMGH